MSHVLQHLPTRSVQDLRASFVATYIEYLLNSEVAQIRQMEPNKFTKGIQMMATRRAKFGPSGHSSERMKALASVGADVQARNLSDGTR